MTTKSTNVNVTILDPTKSEEEGEFSCELSLEENSDDNEGSPEVGKTTQLRLFQGSDLTQLNLVATNGAATIGGTDSATIGIDEDVYVTFTGSRMASLSPPATGRVTIETIGSAYKKDGSACSPVYTFTANEIISNVEVYAVLKVSYIATYTVINVIPSEIGTVMIIDIAACASGETVTASTSITVAAPGEGDSDDDESSCDLSIELIAATGDSGYNLGINHYAKVRYGSDVESIKAINTNGTLSLNSSNESEYISESISFQGTNTASLPQKYVSGLIYTAIGAFYDKTGSLIGTPTLSISEGEASVDKECFGSYNVSYYSSYDLYTWAGDEIGEGILSVISTCSEESINASVSFEIEEEGFSSCCCSCVSSTAELTNTNITLVYKDFITGNVLEGVKVSLNGVAKGVTDSNGAITLPGVKIGEQHGIKGEKEGYLNTDSDSLSNDAFIIQAS